MVNGIFADYYNGAYGSTLMIVTSSKDDLTFLRQLFADLANRDITIKFEELEKFKISGFKTLHLKQIPDNSPSGLRIIDKKLKEPELVWELSALEWLECAELIDGLLLNDSPGHQYLSSTLSDDVLVEVSFKEF